MSQRTAVALIFLIPVIVNAQAKATYRAQRKRPAIARPECAKGAICFSGEVAEGKEFRKALTADLEFVLTLPGGIDIVPTHPDSACQLSQWIANPPLMAHHATEIDAAYDWKAEYEVAASPREFQIVQNCREFQSLYNPVYGQPANQDADKYFEVLNTVKSKGRLWITDSRVTHSHDSVVQGNGAIEWLKFSVEIVLDRPPANSPR